MIIKRITTICFAIAFLMAIVLFTRIGYEYISIPTARIIFMVSGATALTLNIFNFQTGKYNPAFNLMFWIGSLVIFVGLLFRFMYWPYHRHIVIAGIIITGISFFLSPNLISGKSDSSDILDDPKNHS